MRPTSLNPITLDGFKAVMKRFAYDCVYDQFPVLQFEKDGALPTGYERAAEYWPKVLTFRHPDFHSEKHNEPVYDSSEVLDFVLKIIVAVNPSTDRTSVAVEIRAILRSRQPATLN